MIDLAWQRVRRVLVVRLDNLGDVLVTTPAIHAVRTALPDVEITLLASPVGAQVGRLNPDIDDVIVYEAPWIDPWQQLPHAPARELAMVERLRADRFDAGIIFTSYRQSALPAAYLLYLAGIPLRLGSSLDAAGSLLTTRHKHVERLVHEVERNLELVGQVGISPAERELVLRVPEAAKHHAAALRGEFDPASGDRRPLVVVHPGCSMPARTYPAECYVEAIESLVAALGVTVALTGSESECELTNRIVAALDPATRTRVRDLAGRLTFPELCGLIEAADLVVTNNTGPMHIAAATRTPVIALFALTNPPEQWGPWRVPHRLLNHDVACRICYSRVCPHHQECLRAVTPAEIVAAARELGIRATAGSSDRLPADRIEADHAALLGDPA